MLSLKSLFYSVAVGIADGVGSGGGGGAQGIDVEFRAS